MTRRQQPPAIEQLEPRRLLSGTSVAVPASTSANVLLIGSVEGQNPSDLSVDAAGDILGTVDTFPTYVDDDTAFELDPGSHALSQSDPFEALQRPEGSTVVDARGDLFGLTGGLYPGGTPPTGFKINGTLWERAAGSSTIQVLSNFGGSDGTGFIAPADLTVDRSGNLYGTATDVATGQTVLWEDPADGSGPRQLTAPGVAQGPITVDAAGDLFGVTGSNITTQPVAGQYAVYEIPAATVATATAATPAVPTTLATFGVTDLGTPQGLAVDAKGDVYLTSTFASPDGVLVREGKTTYEYVDFTYLLELPAGSGQVNRLALDDQGAPHSAPLVDAAGNVFTVIDSNGFNPITPDVFTAVELPAGSADVETLATLPYDYSGDLTRDADGDLYGTVTSDGDDVRTYAFEITGKPFQVGTSTAPTWSRQPEVTPTPTPTPTPTIGLAPTVTRSTVPTAAVAGAPVRGSIKLTLTNTTAAATTAKGATVVRVYATQDGAIDAGSVLVGTLKKRVVLAKGKSRAITVAVRSAALMAGTYTLLTQVTDGTGDVVTAATGPTLIVAPATVSLSATVKPVVALADRDGFLTVRLTNAGNVVAAGPLAVSIRLPLGATVEALRVLASPGSLSIRPGRTKVFRVRFQVPGGTGQTYYAINTTVALAGASVTVVLTPLLVQH
jgi:hypothetical protein